MHLVTLALSAVGAAALVSPSAAQQLTLSGNLGSYPDANGSLQLSGGSVGAAGALLLSPTKGPTPLNLINPGDPRTVDVGLTGLFSISGVFLPPGQIAVGPFSVPNDPSFLDVPIYMQGLSVKALGIDQLSQSQPAWLAPAGAFRNRNLVQFITPRCTAGLVQRADQRYMIFGGGDGALWAQIATAGSEIYDPVNDSYKAGPLMTARRSVFTTTQLQDGRILITGGVDANNNPINTAEIYDPATDAFTSTASMSTNRYLHSASLLPNGKVMVAGGMTFNSITNLPMMIASTQATTEIYDPATGTWSAGPTMNQPRTGHVAMPLSGNRILMAGGVGWILIGGMPIPQVWTACEIWDPATNAFAPTGSMATPRAVPASIDLGNGKYLFAGGSSTLTQTQIGDPTAAAELYDDASGIWSSAGSLSQARMLMSAFDIGNGRILVPGGATGNIPMPVAVATTDVYNVATNTWTTGPSMSAPTMAYVGYTNQLGQIHILGGASGNNATCLNTTDWYYR